MYSLLENVQFHLNSSFSDFVTGQEKCNLFLRVFCTWCGMAREEEGWSDERHVIFVSLCCKARTYGKQFNRSGVSRQQSLCHWLEVI